jgi:hypothetical protein
VSGQDRQKGMLNPIRQLILTVVFERMSANRRSGDDQNGFRGVVFWSQSDPERTTLLALVRAYRGIPPIAVDLCRSDQFAKRRDDLLRAVGLWQKATTFRQVAYPNLDEARGRNDLDWRPSTSNKSGELQAVH